MTPSPRCSRLRWLLLVLCTAFVASTSPKASVSDADGDGIDDGYEFTLASHFLPEIRYSWIEGCDVTAHRPILFRVRHPSVNGVVNTNFIQINYVRLYNDDCGPNGHDGDNEPFMVWLKAVNGNWEFDWVSATSHYDTKCDERNATRTNVIWVGNSKHGNFADLARCQNGTVCNNECSWNGPTYAHTLYNVGEAAAPLMDNLQSVYGPWGGQYVWSDSKFLDAGHIATSLSTTPFLLLTMPFDLDGCYAACDTTRMQCVKHTPWEPCQANHDACRSDCLAQHVRWDP